MVDRHRRQQVAEEKREEEDWSNRDENVAIERNVVAECTRKRGALYVSGGERWWYRV